MYRADAPGPVQATIKAGAGEPCRHGPDANFVPIVIGPATHHPATAGGGGAANQDGTAQPSQAKVQGASDWLTLLPASGSDSSQSGICHSLASGEPRRRGLALPPRGGSGMRAHAGHGGPGAGTYGAAQAPAASRVDPPIPFLPSTGGTASGPIANGGARGRGSPATPPRTIRPRAAGAPRDTRSPTLFRAEARR